MNKKEKFQCINLRTKKLYVSDLLENDNDGLNDSATSQFWCLGTMSTVGPDDSFAAPEQCSAHRSCFKPKELIV